MESDRGRHPLLGVPVLDLADGTRAVQRDRPRAGSGRQGNDEAALALFSVALGWTGWGPVRADGA
jgi:hypothetical protein